MNKNELLRETIYIIDHLRPLCEFLPGAIKISVVMYNSCTKEKPSVSSSEKGKTKVSRGNKKLQKKKNKRTPHDQLPAMVNSRDQSPIKVNFKRARYNCPTQSDDSNIGDEKVGVALHEAALDVVENPDAVVTAIIPVPNTSDNLVEAVPIQSIPTSSASLFCNLKEDWVRESILQGVESMIDIYKLSTIELCWISSKIEEIFGIVETVMKIKELVDVDWVKEQKILREEEQIHKTREDLTIQQQGLIEARSKLRSSLDLKKREAEQVKADLAEAGFSKL
ncbi:hypothetical protein Cgig2_007492 [Carnegiea gigantea]|uniref:Uncharacterized protein n=1 Tax=Carnegiea gigantea TaxID=171969 RepID=A0A9Q1JKP6_9CARY|nr:hypothetical protein Cgig2_007492 [Carnegiea gigantea]